MCNYKNLEPNFLKMVTMGGGAIIFPMCKSRLCINPNWMKSLVKTLYKSFITLDPFLTPISQVITLLLPQKRLHIYSLEQLN